jgi:hypothetical protein
MSLRHLAAEYGVSHEAIRRIVSMNTTAGLSAEELEEIRAVLMSYLFLTRGAAWE